LRSYVQDNNLVFSHNRFGNEIVIFVSRNQELSEKSWKIERKLRLGKSEYSDLVKQYGLVLGFPECCCDFFTERHVDAFSRDIPFPALSFQNSSPELDFRTNNVMNSESRLNEGPSAPKGAYSLYNHIDKHFLISHVPCSYSCQESIALGKKSLSVLEKNDPRLTQKIISCLKQPVLFFDDLNWAILNGKVDDNETYYDGIISGLEYSNRILETIRQGDRITESEREIVIWRNSKKIMSIRKKSKFDGIVLDFR
jgi:hypothetical protein